MDDISSLNASSDCCRAVKKECGNNVDCSFINWNMPNGCYGSRMQSNKLYHVIDAASTNGHMTKPRMFGCLCLVYGIQWHQNE